MLAKYYKFHVLNSTGQTMTYASGARIDIRFVPWKYVAGVLTYGTVVTDDLGFSTTLATAVSTEGDENDNSTNVYLGLKGYFEVTTDSASSDGSCTLFMEECDATASSDWPSDQADFDITANCIPLAVLSFSAADTVGTNFEV